VRTVTPNFLLKTIPMKSTLDLPASLRLDPLSLALRALLLTSLLALAGCATAERFETSGGGHRIAGDVEGNVVIESHDTHAAISSQFGSVTIERDRARIDQAGWTAIPVDVPVTTNISKHKVSIRAGKVTISRTVN
jgi:hypothetical protein